MPATFDRLTALLHHGGYVFRVLDRERLTLYAQSPRGRLLHVHLMLTGGGPPQRQSPPPRGAVGAGGRRAALRTLLSFNHRVAWVRASLRGDALILCVDLTPGEDPLEAATFRRAVEAIVWGMDYLEGPLGHAARVGAPAIFLDALREGDLEAAQLITQLSAPPPLGPLGGPGFGGEVGEA